MKLPTFQITTPAPASSVSLHPAPAAVGGRPRSGVSRRIRVLLADDHPVVRRGMVACLEHHPHMEVVDEAADGQDALRLARELVPDVLLADIYMPHLSGLDVTKVLHKELPRIKVLLVSMHKNTELALRCVQSGAKGYILKQASAEELAQAIETVNAGHVFFSPEIASVALKQMVRGQAQGPDPSKLTDREREILICVADGLSSKEIASRLNLATSTVETHRDHLMRKLDIHSIAGLTRFALANDLTALPQLAMDCR